MDPKKIKAIID